MKIPLFSEFQKRLTLPKFRGSLKRKEKKQFPNTPESGVNNTEREEEFFKRKEREIQSPVISNPKFSSTNLKVNVPNMRSLLRKVSILVTNRYPAYCVFEAYFAFQSPRVRSSIWISSVKTDDDARERVISMTGNCLRTSRNAGPEHMRALRKGCQDW
ncbi:hypothetical protein TNIN_220831 [Trichonephila inaurata madagascariensis]|uniref:Uncharacterized protein n=1 Tax=Trichonephila inaurata madagascariensis TaxID=2747483 RepID=A0A8X6YCM9_9ARAC|nr:hypothetical protein TNIN_220831 [Trichonephila inaurata madagascariensis]